MPAWSDLTLRRIGLGVFVLQVALLVAHVVLARGLTDQPELTYPIELDRATVVLNLAPGLVGLVLVWARPRNAIGWLIAGAGLSLRLCEAGQTYGAHAIAVPESGLPLGTLALSLSAPLWIPSVAIPVTHLLVRYPSGAILGPWPRRFDRAAAWALVAIYVAYATSEPAVTDVVVDREPPVRLPELVGGPLVLGGAVVLVVCMLGIIGDATRRAWRASDAEGRALQWLLGASVLAVLLVFFGPVEWLGDLAYAGVLVTVSIGVLRYQALGIELTILYGDRNDPLKALNRLGSSIGDDVDERSLADVLDAVREVLDVDGVAVDGPVRAASGTLPEQPTRVPLQFAGSDLGVMLVGDRPGGRGPSRTGQRLVEAVVPLIAAVIHAVRVAEDLRGQQAQVLAATEAERVRLRQELHDGLGPALTGIGLGLEALSPSVPPTGEELVGRLRTEVAASLEETRRIIDDLSPAALDDGDLIGALRRRADQMATGGLDVALEVPESLPSLHPVVAGAALRIVDEALTNVIRHADATCCRIILSAVDDLKIEVVDDGVGPGAPRVGGVGLTSMRQRAERLGGTLTVTPAGPGTRVRATIPREAP